MTRPAPRRRRTQAGFTLIEVLITIFVAAIGLLAVAGLQAISKKFNYDAVQRTSASTLAQSMIESLRSNPGFLDAYLTSDATTATAAVDCAAPDAQCTPLEIAAYDVYRWGQALLGAEAQIDGEDAGGLVDATGCIQAGDVAGLYLVVVAWRGITGLADPGTDDPADDPRRNACGLGLGRYDDPQHSGSDERLRRVIVLEAFVADPNAP
ncbi:MAG: pilV [Panacagrimonas sp.]|jgi:type IV pilus assembly protein PilV|nr:type IV pilus modification protein PilV [Panacagrimonas sp.]MCC2655067.1 pilV [Panacagrimonas sp.]